MKITFLGTAASEGFPAVFCNCEIGAVDQSTIKIINHFSHNGNPLQDVLEEKVKNDGFIVTFDGMTVEI